MRPIAFAYCIKKDGYIYGFAKDFNMLCRWDICGARLTVLGSIPGEKFYVQYLTMKLVAVGDEIYIVPYNAENLWIYHTVSGTWEGVEFEAGKEMYKFAQAFVYGHTLYMIGYFYKAIVKIDLMTKEVGYIREPYDFIGRQYNCKGELNFSYSYAFKDEKTVYLAVFRCGIVLELNLENEHYHIHFVGDRSNGYNEIVKQGERFWLSPVQGGKFICWDGERIVDEFSSRVVGIHDYFGGYGAYVHGSTITFYSCLRKLTVSYDFKLKKIMEEDNQMVYFGYPDGDGFLLQDSTGVVMQLDNGLVDRYDVKIPKETLYKVKESCRNYITEDITWDLSTWLGDHVWHCDRDIGSEEDSVGSKIWEETVGGRWL